jgi:hypothetical protein
VGTPIRATGARPSESESVPARPATVSGPSLFRILIIGSLLPPAAKWKAFFKRQAANPKYLHDGDVVEASVATDDGAVDLGTQRNTVRYA